MALMKWDPSSRKDSCQGPLSGNVVNGDQNNIPNGFSLSNPFSHFYCKRVIVQNVDGQEPVTKIEEAVFHYVPDQSSVYNQRGHLKGISSQQVLYPDSFDAQSRPRKKSSKSRHEHKCSKKDSKTHRKNDKKMKTVYRKVGIAVILVCSALGWWLSTFFWCKASPLDFLGLESSLKSKLIAQEEAVNTLMLNFYRTSSLQSQPPVFLLSGSTGVGKSFIADLIMENFPGSGYRDFIFYHAPDPEVIVKSLKSCEHNLLIYDGLNFKDSHEISDWALRIQKVAVNQKKQLWLLLLFTTEHWTPDTSVTSDSEFHQEILKMSNKIEEIFNRNGVTTQLVTFKPMDAQNIKDCVRKELEIMNIVAEETQLEQIVRDLTRTYSERRKGCKHVKKYFLRSDFGQAQT